VMAVTFWRNSAPPTGGERRSDMRELSLVSSREIKLLILT
jgi:hypothetical protein